MYKIYLLVAMLLSAAVGMAQPVESGELLLAATAKDNAVVGANSEVWVAQGFTVDGTTRVDSVQLTMSVIGHIKVLLTNGLSRSAKVLSSQIIFGTYPEAQVIMVWLPQLSLAKGTYYLVFLNDVGEDHLLDVGLTVSNGVYFENGAHMAGLYWSMAGAYDFVPFGNYPSIMLQLVGRKTAIGKARP